MIKLIKWSMKVEVLSLLLQLLTRQLQNKGKNDLGHEIFLKKKLMLKEIINMHVDFVDKNILRQKAKERHK